MAKLEKEDRFMKLTGILIVFFLVIVTGLLISLQLQLRRDASQEALSREAPSPASISPVETSQDTTPQRDTAPLALPAKQSSRQPAATSHYMREEAKSFGPKEEEAMPEVTPLAALPEPAPLPLPAQITLPAGPTPEPQWMEITVPAGAILTVRLLDTLNSQQHRAGDRFTAALDEPVYSGSRLIAPRGVTVEGHVEDVQQAGRVTGLSEIRLELDRLLLGDGEWVEIVTDTLTKEGEPSRGQDVAKVGAGAAIGAAIGAIAGGRRGAGIGAATGAGASTAEVLLTRGKPVVLSPETRLSFQLRAPLRVTFSSAETPAPTAQFSRGEFQRREWDAGGPRLRRR